MLYTRNKKEMDKRKAAAHIKKLNMLPLVILIFNFLIPILPIFSSFTQTRTIISYGTIYYPHASERLYVEGEYIKKNGEIVHLAGACFGPVWNLEIGIPESNPQAREAIIKNAADAGANFIFISLNLKLWSDPNYDNAKYKENVDAYVQWCVRNKLYFMMRIHNCKTENKDIFSGPGTNWKIAEYEPWRSRALQMWYDIADKYKELPNFVGICPITEPTGHEVGYTKWNLVVQFYIETIDKIREVDPYCIFFLQAPYLASGYPKEWVSRGFIDRDNIVLVYHQYYHHTLKWKGAEWAVIYAEEGPKAGKEAYEKWLMENIISVRNEYDIPILCGEFGIHLGEDGLPDDPYWKQQNTDKIQLFNKYEIHYTQFRLYAHVNGGHEFAMCTSDGLRFNEAGENWASNLPSNLVKP